MDNVVNLIDEFNQVGLDTAPKHILNLYKHVEEIHDIDQRGFKITRPLFSHSSLPSILGLESVHTEQFDWKSNAAYLVLLHHNNQAAGKHIDLIPTKVLDYIRKGKCKLILDNSLEGQNPLGFYKTLYSSFQKLKLPAKSIYYVTNNLYAEAVFNNWAKENFIKNNINVISFPYNLCDLSRLIKSNELPRVYHAKAIYEYRKTSPEKLKTFLKVNRTTRPERDIFMLYLNKNNLFSKFKISFNMFGNYGFSPLAQDLFGEYCEKDNVEQLIKKLPFDIDDTDTTNHGPAGFGKGKFNADLPYNYKHYFDTFISVVMCAFPFEPYSCHLHSSTFNPLYSGHPIIQFGPYKHLQKLKEMGFKTFSNWWDEDYDNIENGWYRFKRVIEIVHSLYNLSTDEILKMNYEMLETLQHNSNLAKAYKPEYKLKKLLFDE